MAAEDLAGLRMLIELSALRRLADRGLSDQEVTLVTALADAATRPACRGDISGYLRADAVFHLRLLELADDPLRAELAQLLFTSDWAGASGAEEPGPFMVRRAREHHELVGLLAEGMVSAADQLLRLHLSRLSPARPADISGRRLVVCAGA